MATVLEVDNLSLHYSPRLGDRVQAVSNVSFQLREGEVLGIAGESGCGKSTLASGCMGLFSPPLHRSAGDVRIDGQSLIGMPARQLRREVLGRKVSIIPQSALNSLNPTRRVGDLARDMLLSHDNRANKRELQERLRERFERIGIKSRDVLNAYPIELPAGTRQRVVIGISTLLNPRVVIADEPTSALDVSTQKAVVRLLFELLDQGVIGSMLFITHELPLLRHVSNNIAVMYAGELVEYGATEDVVFDCRHPYSKALMGSMLSAEPGQAGRIPVPLEGAPPNLARRLNGCRFAERCPEARPNCRADEQLLRHVGGRQVRCQYAE